MYGPFSRKDKIHFNTDSSILERKIGTTNGTDVQICTIEQIQRYKDLTILTKKDEIVVRITFIIFSVLL